MKKTLIAFAALSAIAGMAQAQSTVTIYGLLDANIGSYKTNVFTGGAVQSLSQTKIDSGGLNGSRWGIRVKEDLGGGLSAVGNLESGINLDAGSSAQGGLLFGRRANVGLSGGFGTVVIGRNSSSYDDVSADHAMMGATIFDPSNTNNGVDIFSATFTPASLVSRNTTWVGFNTRFNNSIKYSSNNYGGFSGSIMYSFGENKTATQSAAKTVSANLKYANGPLLVSGGYQSEALTRVGAADPVLENTLLNVAYDFGIVKVGAGFNRAKYDKLPLNATLAAQKEFSLSVAMPLGATTLSAGVAQSKGDDLGKSTGYGVQALYSLSKRTTLYAGAQSTKVYDKLASAIVLAAPTSNVGRVTTYAAGIRHTF